MESAAEPARDAAERERRAQEGAAQRSSLLVEEARDAGFLVLERKGVARRPRYVHARRDDPAEAPLALGRLEPVEQQGEAIARPHVAREVDLPVVHVGDGPRERAPLAFGQERVRDRLVERVVQRRLDRSGDP